MASLREGGAEVRTCGGADVECRGVRRCGRVDVRTWNAGECERSEVRRCGGGRQGVRKRERGMIEVLMCGG